MSERTMITEQKSCVLLKGSRYFCDHICRYNGWIRVRNMAVSSFMKIHLENSTVRYIPLKPGHSIDLPIAKEQVLQVSADTIGAIVEIIEDIGKIGMDTYDYDGESTLDLPVYYSVAVTTTYNVTTQKKGYALSVQAFSDLTDHGVGTIEISNDNAVTWSNAIPIRDPYTDAPASSFSMTCRITHIRVTITSGKINLIYQ